MTPYARQEASLCREIIHSVRTLWSIHVVSEGFFVQCIVDLGMLENLGLETSRSSKVVQRLGDDEEGILTNARSTTQTNTTNTATLLGKEQSLDGEVEGGEVRTISS